MRLATRKVKSFMKGKTVYFNGAGDAKLSTVEQAWALDFVGDRSKARTNREVLEGIAAIMRDYPRLGMQVHGETGNADTAPDRLAAKYGLHPRADVQACMDHLARNRAAAVVDALEVRGLSSAQLVATYKARTGSLKVDFVPLRRDEVATLQRSFGVEPDFDADALQALVDAPGAPGPLFTATSKPPMASPSPAGGGKTFKVLSVD